MDKQYSVGLVADKLKGTLSVADFGGDAKAAIEYAAANGQSLYFPQGGYTLAVDELNTVRTASASRSNGPDGKRNRFIAELCGGPSGPSERAPG